MEGIVIKMKNFKWILLIILSVSILITIMLFINFMSKKQNDNISSDNNNIVNNVLNDIYDKKWHIMNLTVTYENEELFRNDSYNNEYIIIDKETLKYCNLTNKECSKDEYIYNNNKISISTDNTLGTGDYEVIYLDDTLKLSTKINDRIVSYSFVEAKG